MERTGKSRGAGQGPSSGDDDGRIARLERAIEARDEFINIAAHDLKTPLSAMQLHAQMLLRNARKRQPIDPDKLVPKLETIRRQVGKLSQLIDDLLDVSRITRGRIDIDPQSIDLRSIVDEVVEARAADIDRSGGAVDVQAPESVPGTWDPRRIRQIVDHLLSNALKYGRGGDVDLVLEAAEDHIRLSVSDRGGGIAEADQERIFEQFERGPDTEGEGLGLGLWIVKEVVEAMGGAIHVASAPGKGARFTVELPRQRD